VPTAPGDPKESEPTADPVFVALADPTRRRMLERLADGPATITALHAGLPITRQAASKHLRVLAEAGLVTDQKAGRERRYSLAPGALAAASGWLSEIEDRWNRRIAALRRLVEEG
jgi:DNA-binding transcriptional ArsR family regulator